MNLIWTADDIIRAVKGRTLHEQSWTARGVTIDSRATQPGDLFVAIKGDTHDGHDHAAAAIAAGAVAAIVSRQPPHAPQDAPLVLVEDTFRSLEDLGRAGRARAKAGIVGVTGSVGKTSTKDMLRLMLAANGATYANEGGLNNHWGLPLSLARLPQDVRYGVFEMGMNHAGELAALARMAKPHVALITTVEAVHLEFFASVEAIADAKAEIFFGLEPDGAAVLNLDNPHYARLATAAKARGVKTILAFGRGGNADARLLEWSATHEGGEISAEVLGRKLRYSLGAAGEHLALNSLGALLAAHAAGGDVEVCAAALAHYRQPQGRGAVETIRVKGGEATLIDESYNASPTAVRAAIRVLGARPVAEGGRRILVLGDMRELGQTSPDLHAALAAPIAEQPIDLIFCCGAMTKHLYDALPHDRRGAHAPDSAALAPLVAETVRPGDAVTVKGSLSMQMKRIVEALRQAVQIEDFPPPVYGRG